jgi:hypothetical protein
MEGFNRFMRYAAAREATMTDDVIVAWFGG